MRTGGRGSQAVRLIQAGSMSHYNLSVIMTYVRGRGASFIIIPSRMPEWACGWDGHAAGTGMAAGTGVRLGQACGWDRHRLERCAVRMLRCSV